MASTSFKSFCLCSFEIFAFLARIRRFFGVWDKSTNSIGMAAAGKAGSVIGVEVNRDAVRDAVTNAKRNNMKNITFCNEDAGEFMVKMAAQGETADVVFMDPPRAGSDEAFLSSLLQLSPKRVVYISCNPVTQARDLKYLTSHGYRVERCQPVDMFPWTYHIENIVALVQKIR